MPPPLSIATLIAFVVVHVSVEAPPCPMIAGEAVKLSIVGGEGTVIYAAFVSVSALPPGPLTVRLTVYVPGAAEVWVGLCAVLVPPSPNFQAQAAMVPVEASVKATIKGAGPEVTSALKAATGGGTTVTVTGAVTVPPEPVAVSV